MRSTPRRCNRSVDDREVMVEYETYRYFAYGSNMLERRIRAKDRAPSARVLGTGYVVGRRLKFDKVSRADGSGKCDAEWTGSEMDRVYGVVYEIARHDKNALDRVEGLGNGYEERTVAVETGDGVVEAVAYIATRKERDLRPYHWYKALAVAGAVEHGLPGDYIERLRAVESIEDRNAERCAEHEALLSAG